MPEAAAKELTAGVAPTAGRLHDAAAQWGLRRGGRLVYWGGLAPMAARLPAKLGYRVACAWGDLTFRIWPERDSELQYLRHLRGLLDEGVIPEDVESWARDFWRFRACEVIDVMRLRGQARSLGRLVEIRGQAHLEDALEKGRGAILCSAHFGSYLSTFSLLHANGFPLTCLGRWDWNYHTELSRLERRFWDLVYARRVLRHRQRQNLEPWEGRTQVAAQAAAVLRNNEVVMLCSDAPPIAVDRARAVEVPFLGRRATLLPGVVTLAKLTGAPLLMSFSHRLDDYRHQVLEISPPVPLTGDLEEAFGRCAAAIDAAIRANPLDWYFWFQRDNLAGLGLLSAGEAVAGPR
jgi:KDO2-lipid IV(A) lauroyltransferase